MNKVTVNPSLIPRLIRYVASQASGVADKALVFARFIVPVDTGRLQASIAPHKAEYVFGISTDVPYAAHVEYGTATQRAQPYMRPALDQAVADYNTLSRTPRNTKA